MHRMIPAPLSASLRLAIVAPAASNSESPIEAPSPAPFSTTVSAPSAANFFTVSGIAAQRVSPAASLRTAIFTSEGSPVGFDEDERDKADNQTGNRAPLHHLGEARVVVDMDRDVLRRRTHQQRLLFGHYLPLCMSNDCRVHNKARRAAQPPTLRFKSPFTRRGLGSRGKGRKCAKNRHARSCSSIPMRTNGG